MEIPNLGCRSEWADMVQVYKILHERGKIDKDKLFTLVTYGAAREISLKLFKPHAQLMFDLKFSAIG